MAELCATTSGKQHQSKFRCECPPIDYNAQSDSDTVVPHTQEISAQPKLA